MAKRDFFTVFCAQLFLAGVVLQVLLPKLKCNQYAYMTYDVLYVRCVDVQAFMVLVSLCVLVGEKTYTSQEFCYFPQRYAMFCFIVNLSIYHTFVKSPRQTSKNVILDSTYMEAVIVSSLSTHRRGGKTPLQTHQLITLHKVLILNNQLCEIIQTKNNVWAMQALCPCRTSTPFSNNFTGYPSNLALSTQHTTHSVLVLVLEHNTQCFYF